MTCSSCGHDNPTESSFCLECGGRLAISCDGCGTELPANAKFCNRCGHSTSSHSSGDAERNPRDYTPKHLADRILQSKSALEGERTELDAHDRAPLSQSFRLVPMLLLARLRGDHAQSPFFDASCELRVEPRVLTDEERQDVERRRDSG